MEISKMVVKWSSFFVFSISISSVTVPTLPLPFPISSSHCWLEKLDVPYENNRITLFLCFHWHNCGWDDASVGPPCNDE